MYDAPTSEEIKQAMLKGAPVESGGITYARISAYSYCVGRDRHTGKYRAFYTVELTDKNENSVTITTPNQIKILS